MQTSRGEDTSIFQKLGFQGTILEHWALLTAGQLPPDNGPSLNDPRVASVLALSPPVFVKKNMDLTFTGYSCSNNGSYRNKRQRRGRRNKSSSAENSVRQYSKVDKYLVVLLDGDHRVYAGRKVGAKQVTDRAYQETIARQSADFWTAYLSNDGAVLEQMRSYGKTGPLSNVHIERQLGDRGGS